MTKDLTPPVVLSAADVRALARRIVADRIDTREDWLLWEDYPLLSEMTWTEVTIAVDELAVEAQYDADAADRAESIDSMLLMERTRG